MAYTDMAIVSMMAALPISGNKNWLELNGVEVMGYTPIYPGGRKGAPQWRFMIDGKPELREFRSPKTTARHWAELQQQRGA